MKNTKNWIRITWLFGVIALILGVIDPMEGSVLIAIGSIMLVISTYMNNDPDWRYFLVSSGLILTGVSFLFYLSSLGGFGGNSEKSWWWGALILPYPAGWLMTIILLIIRMLRKRTKQD